MGFLFDDPRNGLAEKHWMQLLGMLIESSIENKNGLVSVDGEFKTKSCYAELHRKSERNFNLLDAISIEYRWIAALTFQSHPVGSDGQNHIVARTPLQLLPKSQFENCQNASKKNTPQINATTAQPKNLDMSGAKSSNPNRRPPKKKSKRKPKHVIKW